MASGFNAEPVIPQWPGRETFTGPITHSSAYRNGASFRGQRVLVVGFGNSGAEIAMDLWEHGASPTVSVRSPVNVIPREILGIPILALAIPLARLPWRLADVLTAPVVRLVLGDPGRLGLPRSPVGPFGQIRRQARIPVIDVGTVRLIRQGHIVVRPGIERFIQRGVVFADGRPEAFDAVILATGFRPSLDRFLECAEAVTDHRGIPRRSGRETPLPGLYFCGFFVSPTGVLREINLEARWIARDIDWRLRDWGDASPAPSSQGSQIP